MKKLKTWLRRLVPWALLVVCVAWGAGNVRQIHALYPAPSLRFTSPVLPQQANEAKQALANEQNVPWPTWWSETTAKLEANGQTLESEAVVFDGNASLVLPAAYSAGGAPGPLDTHGCAISKAAAWALWGSYDVVGLPVTIDGQEHLVRGVFEDVNARALVNRPNYEPGWHNAELAVPPGPGGAAAVDEFLNTTGLPKPNAVLYGGILGGVTTAAILVPLLCWAGLVLASLVRALVPPRHKSVLRWVLPALAFALVLPALLQCIPPAMVPTKWSDFGFWQRLLQQVREGANTWLGLVPGARDVAAKWLLLGQGACTVLLVALLPALYKRLVLPMQPQNIVVSPAAAAQNHFYKMQKSENAPKRG